MPATKKTKKKPAPKPRGKTKPRSLNAGKRKTRAAKKLATRSRALTSAIRKADVKPYKLREPISYFGVRLASLVLLLFGALTSCGAVTLAGYDMQQSSALAQSVLAQTEPKEHLYQAATERGLDYGLLAQIAKCESHWRMVPNARSSAYGYFQILDATEYHTPQYKEGRRKFDPITNVDMAVYLFERYGTNPWNESKPCWGWYVGTRSGS